MSEVHYCRGDELLAMQQDALPKDEDGRTKPGFRAYLIPREHFERQMTAELAEMQPTAN